mgnify:FL=1
MSLMRTLAKVAIGVAVAKGAKAVMQNNKSGANGGGLGGLLGGLTGGDNRRSTGADGANARSGGGIEDMLGGLLGGTSGTSQGGLGGLLNRFGKSTGGNSSGGLGGLLGGLAGAAGAGGLLSGLDRKVEAAPDRPEADFGAVLNSQFSASATPPVPPSKDQEALAGLMISAMIQAAKSDGTFDDKEREKLLSKLNEADPDEEAFVKAQMDAPVDVDKLVAQTPDGMGPKVYAMALLAIELDTQQEAQFLHKLANGYGMTPGEVNEIHSQVGVPSLYT